MNNPRQWAAPAGVFLRENVEAVLLAVAVAFAIRANPEFWNGELAADALGWVAIVGAYATVLHWRFPKSAPALLLGSLALYYLVGVGVASAFAVALLFAACYVLGAGALRLVSVADRTAPDFAPAFLLGLALYLCLFGALIHFPVNKPMLYLELLAAPVLAALFVAPRALVDGARAQTARLNATLAAIPFPVLVAAVIVIGFVARFAFMPTAGGDENHYHLRLWSDLTFFQRYRFDVATHAFADTPFAADLAYATVALVANGDSRGAWNLALLLLILVSIWRMCRPLDLSGGQKLLALSLFASTPMVAWLLYTLHVELFLAAVAAAALVFIAAPRKDGAPKFDGRLLVGLPILALLTFTALHAYAYAWIVTKNPVLPFFNAIFHSPFFPDYNFADTRWSQGFTLGSYANMFFRTDLYGEYARLTGGFQYLFLLPLGFILLPFRAPRVASAVIALVTIVFGAAMFSQIQYLRYLFPVMPLASVAIAALLPGAESKAGFWARRGARFALLACCAANFCFLPGIGSVFGTALQKLYTVHGREKLMAAIAPHVESTQYLNSKNLPLRAVYLGGVSATLRGDAIQLHWFSPTAYARFNAMKTESDVAAFLKDFRADYVVVDWAASTQANFALMRDYLSQYGLPEHASPRNTVYRVQDHKMAYRPLIVGMAQSLGPGWKDIGSAPTGGAAMARLSARFACAEAKGSVALRVIWSNGEIWQRDIACAGGEQTYAEAGIIPVGVHTGWLAVYVSQGRVDVQETSLESN